jgi:hypothetical protein
MLKQGDNLMLSILQLLWLIGAIWNDEPGTGPW